VGLLVELVMDKVLDVVFASIFNLYILLKVVPVLLASFGHLLTANLLTKSDAYSFVLSGFAELVSDANHLHVVTVVRRHLMVLSVN